jgi:hypothetical protein
MVLLEVPPDFAKLCYILNCSRSVRHNWTPICEWAAFCQGGKKVDGLEFEIVLLGMSAPGPMQLSNSVFGATDCRTNCNLQIKAYCTLGFMRVQRHK